MYTSTDGLLSNLSPIACNNNDGLDGLDSAVSFLAQEGTIYYIAVDGAAGSTGMVQLNYDLDIFPPTVSFSLPASGDLDVAPNTRVVIGFSEPMNIDTLDTTTIQLRQNGAIIEGTVAVAVDQMLATFIPSGSLGTTTVTEVTVVGAEDLAGNPNVEHTFQFTTGTQNDTDAPTVVASSPPNEATDIPTNVTISMETSEPVDFSTVNDQNFNLRNNDTGELILVAFSISTDQRTINFDPDVDLAVATSYTAFVSRRGITDLAGNLLTGDNISFTTAFGVDAIGPQVVSISPPDGLTGAPINTQVVLHFDEPVQPFSVKEVRLSQDGADVAVNSIVPAGNQTFIITPTVALGPDTAYTVDIGAVKDGAGNVLVNPGAISFVTGAIVDDVPPTVVLVDPADGADAVPTNATVTVAFDEVVGPSTISESTLGVFVNSPREAIEGVVEFDPESLTATFTPDMPLPPLAFLTVEVSGITDLAGNPVNPFGSFFTTGDWQDTEMPSVVSVSPPDTSAGVPINTPVAVRLSEPLNPFSVGATAVVLANGVPVVGSVNLDDSRTVLNFNPDLFLESNSGYTIAVGGFTDTAGNPVTPFLSSFTIMVGGLPDVDPLVASVNPLPGAIDVPVTSDIVVTFDEAIDPTTVNSRSMPISIAGTGNLAGNYAISGNEVVFTPLSPLPGNSLIELQINAAGVRDLAGNGNELFQSNFTTADGIDVTPPIVLAVTPNDEATGFGPRTEVELTFSESLNPATINGSTCLLFANGAQLSPTVTASDDNRTITLNQHASEGSIALPTASEIAVVVTSGVEDLSGNNLSDFQSIFSTAQAPEGAGPSVVAQRPSNGASEENRASELVLFVDKPLNPATVSGALFVVQNGALVGGMTRVTGNGRVLEFSPDELFEFDTLIRVFLTSDAQDLAGNELNSYQGSFQTEVAPGTTIPLLLRSSPANRATGVPRNSVFEAEFDEPLDPAFVNDSNVLLHEVTSGLPRVPATVSLIREDRVIRVVPDVTLDADTRHFVDILDFIRDLDGTRPPTRYRRFFTTADQIDELLPSIVDVSPPDGALGVGVNTSLRVSFGEPINPLTATGSTLRVTDGDNTVIPCTYRFEDNNQEVTLVPQKFLTESSVHTLTIEGVEDLAGNLVIAQVTQFTTGLEPDTEAPIVVQTNPLNLDIEIPTNVAVSLEVNEPLDFGTVNSSSFLVRDDATALAVSGSYGISADLQRITFISDAPLAAGTSHTVLVDLGGITDLSGNLLVGGNFSFTTGSDADTVNPLVVGTSPSDGMFDVPTNVEIVIDFDEPIAAISLAEVTLSSIGGEIAVNRSLSAGARSLTLKPELPLSSLLNHTLTVGMVGDPAGNPLAVPLAVIFTTGFGADVTAPQIISIDPADGAVDVSLDAIVDLAGNISGAFDSFFTTGAGGVQGASLPDRPNGPPVIEGIQIAEGLIRVVFNSVENVTYRLEMNDSEGFDPTGWTIISEEVVGTGSMMAVEPRVSVADKPFAFYRIVSLGSTATDSEN